MSKVEVLLRQVRKIRDALDRAERDRPAAGMVVVRYLGLSGLLRQAKEDGIADERGNLLRPSRVSLDQPRPAGGFGMLLWDAKKRRAERQVAGETVATEPGEDP